MFSKSKYIVENERIFDHPKMVRKCYGKAGKVWVEFRVAPGTTGQCLPHLHRRKLWPWTLRTLQHGRAGEHLDGYHQQNLARKLWYTQSQGNRDTMLIAIDEEYEDLQKWLFRGLRMVHSWRQTLNFLNPPWRSNFSARSLVIRKSLSQGDLTGRHGEQRYPR